MKGTGPARFLLIGIGPFAKRTYIPHLLALEQEGRANLLAAVDVLSNQDKLIKYQQVGCPNVELLFVPHFTLDMPEIVQAALTELVDRLKITSVIISTEPLSHRAYGLWALNLGLNIVMDKPVTTRQSTVTCYEEAYGISQDYDELLVEYQNLQLHQKTIFLVNSHRRYHPGFHFMLDLIKDVQGKTACPVTNIISTHCDGQWRLPSELLDQPYHGYNMGYGKVSHSGYHFLDCVYQFMKAGMSEEKQPDMVEVVSSFIQPNGFLTQLNTADYERLFGAENYSKVCEYSDEQLRTIFENFGEIDAAIQITFYKNGDAVALAQVNLQHNGFGRRSWINPGEDLYKGNGRVRHEMQEIKMGPFQTIVMESRRAHAKYDRSIVSDASLGSDNHFEVKVFRNCEMLGEEKPLSIFNVADIEKRSKPSLPGLYSEDVKRGVLEEAVDFLEGKKGISELRSNLPDHSLPVHIMSAVYVSHIRRKAGMNPVVPIRISYNAGGQAQAQIQPQVYDMYSDSNISSPLSKS